jgi:hypothetical protein
MAPALRQLRRTADGHHAADRAKRRGCAPAGPAVASLPPPHRPDPRQHAAGSPAPAIAPADPFQDPQPSVGWFAADRLPRGQLPRAGPPPHRDGTGTVGRLMPDASVPLLPTFSYNCHAVGAPLHRRAFASGSAGHLCQQATRTVPVAYHGASRAKLRTDPAPAVSVW